MANLQGRGMDDEFCGALKRLADAENRSLSQRVVLILREYLAKRAAVARAKTPAVVLVDLSGSWEDDRSAPEIVADLAASPRSSRKYIGRGPLMYLLDTDILIYALKGVPEVVASLERHRADPLAVSVVTLMELYYGAHKSQQVAANLAKVGAIEHAFTVVDVGPECAEAFGVLKARLEQAGPPLDDFDLTLAATALARNLVLVSNDTRHFERVPGLRLENWARP